MSPTQEPTQGATATPEKRVGIGICELIAVDFDEWKITREQLKAIYNGKTFDPKTSGEIVYNAMKHFVNPPGTPRPRMKDPVADALLLDLIKSQMEREVR